jgi:hypothetical protein
MYGASALIRRSPNGLGRCRESDGRTRGCGNDLSLTSTPPGTGTPSGIRAPGQAGSTPDDYERGAGFSRQDGASCRQWGSGPDGEQAADGSPEIRAGSLKWQVSG